MSGAYDGCNIAVINPHEEYHMFKIELIDRFRLPDQQPVSKKLIEEPEDFWMEPEKELRF